MTEAKPRVRRRGLKTWTAFGNLGRRPSEYEIVTHNMNHTTNGLELGPEVNGNRWLQEHRDGMRLTVADWDGFRDPDQVTYASYMAEQDDQETYIEGLLEQFDREGHDESLSDDALELLGKALTPCRYLGHGLQMLSANVQQLAVSSYVSNCAVFQTADQLRRVQLNAYRTTQLKLSHESRGFGTGERDSWENDADWQPIRKAVELALVDFDWDRAFTATNLVVKPVADALFLDQLSKQAAEVGARLDELILENLLRDVARSRRWTAALGQFVTDADEANRGVLQEYVDELAPLGQAMIDGGSSLLASWGSRKAEDIAADVRSSWSELLESAGLRLDAA